MRPLNELMNLSGRKALVTGGAGHVGLVVGQAIVEMGGCVAVLDTAEPACHERAETLSRIRADSARAFPCDLSDEQATRRTIRKAAEQMGGLDIIVHSAALVGMTQVPGWAVPFERQSVEAWQAGMQVNLTAAFVIVQEAKKALVASGHGSVILIASTYGLVGPDNRLYEGTEMAQPAGYAASKGGLLQLTRYLATTLAPDVRVNAISPGGLLRGQPEAFQRRYVARTPLGRMGTEEDLKGAMAYLASDLSAYVTGQNLVVDGGWTAW